MTYSQVNLMFINVHPFLLLTLSTPYSYTTAHASESPYTGRRPVHFSAQVDHSEKAR